MPPGRGRTSGRRRSCRPRNRDRRRRPPPRRAPPRPPGSPSRRRTRADRARRRTGSRAPRRRPSRRASKPVGQALRELEAQVEAMCPDVEQQVARRRRRAACLRRRTRETGAAPPARPAEQPVPQLGADPRDAGQLGLGDPEADRALQSGDVGEQIADLVLGARLDGQHQEDRRLGDPGQNGLGLRRLHRILLSSPGGKPNQPRGEPPVGRGRQRGRSRAAGSGDRAANAARSASKTASSRSGR